MAGTTEAACSAYSSLESGFTVGLHTGPTEISWTSTLSGSEVQRAAQTKAEEPTRTKAADKHEDENSADSTDGSLVVTDDFLYDGTLPTSTDTTPLETGNAAGALSRPLLLAAALGGLVTALLAA